MTLICKTEYIYIVDEIDAYFIWVLLLKKTLGVGGMEKDRRTRGGGLEIVYNSDDVYQYTAH